jgi:ferredoxin
MKVVVDPEKCQGHTLCAMRAPDVFELSDVDGHASVVMADVPESYRDDVLEAVSSCPEQAISVS